MSYRLRDNVNNQWVEAANALRGKKARRRIVAYVESYDDIYFWRTVLSRFEDDRRYFEVMLPSKMNLTRGKKSVLMNFIRGERIEERGERKEERGERKEEREMRREERLGDSMIACVDADYDYLIQGATDQSRKVLQSPYVFHTYVYAIENYQCYAPSLHDVCVAVTLNDHRIFDFRDYFARFSEAIFPLFVWSIMFYRNGNYPRFSISDFNRIADPGGFTVQNPDASLNNVKRKVGVKIRELQRQYPNAKDEYLHTKDDLRRLGVTPQSTYLYIQGHHLFDTVVAPILTKVCNQLRQERQTEIYHAQAHRTQKRNEMSCYENSRQDIKTMLKKNTGYQQCPLFIRLQGDVERYLKKMNASANAATTPEPAEASADQD
ncbi:MAG: DUF4435 domain-containing protein [Prevotella sp.]|nr:DUF4435 domain-containing protein [Prevotella sp.]